MSKWLESITDNGFRGNITVEILDHSFQGLTVCVKILDKDGDELFNEHKHGSNLSETVVDIINSLTENILWEINEDRK